MGVGRSALVIGVVFGIAGAARADDRATVDWAQGMVIASGVGVADRQAPNPAVARGPSRHRAELAAEQRIAAALPTLPLAGGGTLASKLSDPAVKERIDRAVDAAITLDAEPETDGAWRVTMAVPIEAIRQAIVGPRALDAAGDRDPPVVIVTGVSAKPAVGFSVGGIAAATIWVRTVPTWAREAPRVKARSGSRGAIELASPTGGAATLFVLMP